MDGDDRALLERSHQRATILQVTVAVCRYTCCARGWSERDYEATYQGRVAGLDELRLLLLSDGIGTLNYAITAQLSDVLLVCDGERRDAVNY